MSTGSNFSSLHITAVSVLAGLGVGYLVGILTAKWVWRGSGSTAPRQLDQPELAAAIIDLTTEMCLLRNSVAANLQSAGRQSRHTTTETTDYMSAIGGSDAEDEFFDINEVDDPEAVRSTLSPQHNFNYLDQVGKMTQESKAACLTLLETVEELLKETPEATGLLWRQARALVHLSMHHVCEKEKELKLLVQAAEVARKALDLDENVWQSHQWYAISVGSQAKHQGTQKKIITGHEYKDHIDLAVRLNKSEPTLYHLRGRWYYEVAGISWLESKAASALYAVPPKGTYKDALEDFMRVEQLTPGVWLNNMLMVAKCHIALGDTPLAMEWLQRTSNLPIITKEDITSRKEVGELLSIQ